MSVKCRTCGHENPEGGRFCLNCGAPMEATPHKLSQAIDDISDQHTILLDPKVMQQRLREEQEKKAGARHPSTSDEQSPIVPPAPNAQPAAPAPPPIPSAAPARPSVTAPYAVGTPAASSPPPRAHAVSPPAVTRPAPSAPPPAYIPPPGQIPPQAAGVPPVSPPSSPPQPRYPLAELGPRTVAFLVDILILLAVTTLASIPFRTPEWTLESTPEELYAALVGYLAVLVVDCLIVTLYFTVFVGRYGQTPGKMIMKIKVVGLDDGPVSYSTAFLRFVGHMFDWTLCFAGYIFAFTRPDRRALHDLISDTKVVSIR